jgi:flagellar assembly protein FliH
MSTSPERAATRVPVALPYGREPVVRGLAASRAATANFDVDLRGGPPAPPQLVEQVRQAARAAGYAEGWAQGQRAAAIAAQAANDQFAAAAERFATARRAALDRGLAAIATAVGNLDARVAPALAETEDAVLAGALELAVALLGRELSDSTPGLDALRRAVAQVPATQPVAVRLNPDDHEALLGRADHEYREVVAGREVALRADPTLRPGDAIAEYGTTTVDARLSAAIERVKEVLAR